jgi:hypothetical protein
MKTKSIILSIAVVAGAGTVIGKALSALKGDRGVIDLLVILQ